MMEAVQQTMQEMTQQNLESLKRHLESEKEKALQVAQTITEKKGELNALWLQSLVNELQRVTIEVARLEAMILGLSWVQDFGTSKK